MRYVPLCVAVCLWSSTAMANDAGQNTPTDAQALAHAQALKAQYDAQTAQYQSQEERIKAAQAGVPTSGIANTAAAGSSAGTAEANYLAAGIINDLAIGISDIVGSRCATEKPQMVIFADVTAPDLSDWFAFDQRLSAVRADMKKASDDADLVLGRPIAPVVVAALAPAALSFLASNDALQGVSVTQDNSMLVADVASSLKTKHCKVRIASAVLGARAAQDLSARLGDIAALAQTLAGKQTALKSKSGANADQARANLTTAIGEYNQLKLDLYGGPAVADGKVQSASISLGTIVKHMAIASQLSGGVGVFVKIQSAAGGLFTSKNVTTFFGASPFRVSASAVATYIAIDGSTDEVSAAGTVEKLLPYTSLKKLK